MSKSMQRVDVSRKLLQHFLITVFVRSLFEHCDDFLKFRGWLRKLRFVRLENLDY